MNADAVSDLLLAITCVALAVNYWRTQPGFAQAAAIVGLAASFGVLRFSGLEAAIGPHRFFSLFAACAAFPLLAVAVCWPGDQIAKRPAAAARFVLLAGAIGLSVSLGGFVWWQQALPVLAVFGMLCAVCLSPDPSRIAGVLALAGSLAMAALGQPSIADLGPFTTLQLMHCLMAVGLLFLSWKTEVGDARKIVG